MSRPFTVLWVDDMWVGMDDRVRRDYVDRLRKELTKKGFRRVKVYTAISVEQAKSEAVLADQSGEPFPIVVMDNQLALYDKDVILWRDKTSILAPVTCSVLIEWLYSSALSHNPKLILCSGRCFQFEPDNTDDYRVVFKDCPAEVGESIADAAAELLPQVAMPQRPAVPPQSSRAVDVPKGRK